MLRLDAEERAIADVALRMARAGLSDSPDGRYLNGKMTALIERIEQYQKDKENGDV